MDLEATVSRKDALKLMLLTAASAGLPLNLMAQQAPPSEPAALPAKTGDQLTIEDLLVIERAAGLEFTEAERKEVLAEVQGMVKGYQNLRKMQMEQRSAPAVVFEPVGAQHRPGSRLRVATRPLPKVLPQMSDEDLAFADIATLGRLLRAKQVTSVQLTQIYLKRLKQFDPVLLCVVSLCEESAIRFASQMDVELGRGRDRGPLHGIPYGLKDIFAARVAKTTWGATNFKDQMIDADAQVVTRLEQAGAVLVAKLTTGALAMDDGWFGGKTRNPWNPSQGSSGSSAGPASATAAGLVAFAIGSETQGSIMSPSLRCRTSGLRPSFGRVSRAGAMELSYSMDKVGPICRSAQDCALVFAAIAGRDDADPTTVDMPFDFRPRRDLKGVKVGYLAGEARLQDDPVVATLRTAGAIVTPAKLTPMAEGVDLVLSVECAAAFDNLTASGEVRKLENSAWPPFFRAARHITAVEYLTAQRARRAMAETFLREIAPYDLLLDQGIGLSSLAITNQVGTPQAIIPFGESESGESRSRTFIGKLYGEDLLLEVADFVQQSTEFHRQRPKLG